MATHYTTLPLAWTVGPTADPSRVPDRSVPAAVPGAVQLDWAAAQGWPPIETQSDFPVRYATRGRPIATDYEWMEDQHWVYRAALPRVEAQGQRVFFVASVDYACEVRLRGECIAAREGMNTPIEIDLTDRAAPGDALEVVVRPVPKAYREPIDEKQGTQSCKAPFSYGWDFHPRLIPLGIWDGGHLEVRPACHLRRAEVRYELADDFSSAQVEVEAEVAGDGRGVLRWTLADPQGRVVWERTARVGEPLAGTVRAPELWWPNGQGAQPLYRSTVELLEGDRVVDRREARAGFRRARLVPFEGSWEDPDVVGFPATSHKPPFTVEFNGRRIFAKGSNWVGPDLFPARVTAERHRALLLAARDAHFNLLRCWGGAPVQKDSFFDLCDELGLMVWQEFPLAYGRYEATPGYMAVLDQESRSIIRRLRSRACLLLWCGGNELFNHWSRMTDQDLAPRLLDRNAFDLDPARPFLKTSPLAGWAHGPYQFRQRDGREVFQIFARTRFTGYTEFGVPGPAGVECLRRILPEEELFPPRPDSRWTARHGFAAWGGSPDSWLELWCLEHYFGKPENLEQLVAWGQWLQAEGCRFVFEEARRQKPRCSMALNWCFNEPWPTAANNSLLSWPAEPKPALAAVRDALRPVLASARVPKFSWQAGEAFSAELFLLGDGPEPLPAGRIDATLEAGGVRIELGSWDHPAAPPNVNLAGPRLEAALPAGLPAGRLHLVLRAGANPAWDSRYRLLSLGRGAS